MLQRFRASMARFMTGRNGVDQLGWFLLILSVVLNLIGSFARLPIFQLLAYIPLALTLYRTFSRNVPKRYAENQKFTQFSPGSRAGRITATLSAPAAKPRSRYPRVRAPSASPAPAARKNSVKKT